MITTSATVLCLGEVLIDWVCCNKSLDLNHANQFLKRPGGAPANVAMGLARLQSDVTFLGALATLTAGAMTACPTPPALRAFLTNATSLTV